LDLVGQAARSGKAGEAPEAFADRLGLEKGVTGYMYHTVPVALQAWFRNPGNLHAALTDVIALGGDTDTAAAIVGGIVGAGLAPDDIPARLREGWRDWPLTLTWLERLADSAARAIHSQTAQKPPRLFFPAKLFRNLFFMAVVLAHGFRRLLPPY
jgi:hypothetical protein